MTWTVPLSHAYTHTILLVMFRFHRLANRLPFESSGMTDEEFLWQDVLTNTNRRNLIIDLPYFCLQVDFRGNQVSLKLFKWQWLRYQFPRLDFGVLRLFTQYGLHKFRAPHFEKQFFLVLLDIFPASLYITTPIEGHCWMVESETENKLRSGYRPTFANPVLMKGQFFHRKLIFH